MNKAIKLILHLYYYLWIASFKISMLLGKPFILITNIIAIKILKKNKKDIIEAKTNYYKANFEFPGGIIDWYAFAMVIGIFAIILFLFSIYIFWIPHKIFLLITILFGIWIWILAEKNKSWFQNKIKIYLIKQGYGDYLK